METLKFTKYGLFLAILSFLCLIGCSKIETNEFNDLQTRMSKIEANIIAENFVVPSISREIVNKNFFQIVDEIRSAKELSLMEEKLKTLSNYRIPGNNLFKIPSKSEDISENKINIPQEEFIILKSLRNALKNNPKTKSIDIIDYYINEIPCLNLSNSINDNCLEVISFYKDVLIYFKYNQEDQIKSLNENSKGNTELTHRKYHCLYRDCFDCCMNTKLEAMRANNNLIDWIKAIISFPENLLWMIGSCGWDCTFHS